MYRVALIAVVSLTSTKCNDFANSIEVNGIEVSPFYETIILKDVADTLNDFDNKGFDQFLKNESDSEEDVEDLLSEYQHYLDRAHKQIKTYMEKSKPKNKIPLLRREKFIKPRLNPNDHPDIFLPIATRIESVQPIPIPPKGIQDILNIPKLFIDEFRPINFSPMVDDSLKIHCQCKGSEECSIKCSKTLERLDSTMIKQDELLDPKQDNNDGNMNIRVNVDIEMPKLLIDIFGKMAKHLKEEQSSETFAPKHSNILNLSSPFLNFPIPMQFFGSRRPKSNQHEFVPLRKITIHKKRKSKSGNGKKHHKKFITFHKLEPQRSIQNFFVQNLNISDIGKIDNKSANIELDGKSTNFTEEKLAAFVNVRTVSTTKTDSLTTKPEAQTVNSIFLMVNISNNLDENQNITNSVENDSNVTKTTIKVSDKANTIILRKKREVMNETTTTSAKQEVQNSTTALPEPIKIEHESSKNINKSIEMPFFTSNITLDKVSKITTTLKKNITYEMELTYWPISINKTTNSSNNITSLVIEKENNKAKLNFSKDMVRNNRTEALEHAIFGEVDWNDVNVVAPVFLSFMGKYITGVLTFCSYQICHSMKCAEKSCNHRLCTPDQRYNKMGHCTGLDSKDSVISMESIMDLPSNVAFEIVDILENKMLGRLYGKATLCIGSKCITFVASKKNFTKSRCSNKELNAVGHCTNIKNVKAL